MHLKKPFDAFTFGIFLSFSLKSAKGWQYKPNNNPVLFNKFWSEGNLIREERIRRQDELSVSFTVYFVIVCGGWLPTEVVKIFSLFRFK